MRSASVSSGGDPAHCCTVSLNREARPATQDIETRRGVIRNLTEDVQPPVVSKFDTTLARDVDSRSRATARCASAEYATSDQGPARVRRVGEVQLVRV